ncbi:MAG: uroporphyrinogen-III C-methyltransferase [Pseudomonadota bacterium]
MSDNKTNNGHNGDAADASIDDDQATVDTDARSETMQDDGETAEEQLSADDAAATASDDAALSESAQSNSNAPDADFDPAESGAAAANEKGSKLWLCALALLALVGAGMFAAKDTLFGTDDGTQEDAPAAVAQPRDEPDTRAPASTTPTAATVQPAADLIPAATVAETDRLQQQLERLGEQLEALESSVDTLRSDVRDQSQQTSQLEADIEQRVDLLDSLPGRVRNTEEALVTLKGISAGSRSAWLLAEAEYYLQIGNAQLQLANNPELASKALQLADQRVRELGDPAYTPVRRALAQELTALAGLKRTDIEGVTLTLGSLASLIDELPLDNKIERAERDTSGDAALTGMARVKATVRNAAASLVSWRKSDESVKAMLSPEAEYFLRLNVQLQLQAARLSLLLGDDAGYQQSLGDAREWISSYFDNSDERVINALDMINGVSDVKRNNKRPDISGSLSMLRQQRDLASADRSTTTVPVDPAADAAAEDNAE